MKELKRKIAGEITLAKSPGASLKKWREIFGITQTELAEYLDITPSTISDYEGNRRKSPGIRVIKRFIDALVELDKRKGGEVVNRIAQGKTSQAFEVKEFPQPVSGSQVIQDIEGKVITNKRKIKQTEVMGYSIVDSLKAILELPVEEFPRIYGPTPTRAVIFTKVSVGRSPMVAIRVTKFKPSLVIYQGLEEMKDPIARKISEVEKIPIVLTTMPLARIREKLGKHT